MKVFCSGFEVFPGSGGRCEGNLAEQWYSPLAVRYDQGV